MSKIAKGVKKVFKGVGKVLKKIAKPVLIGAAIFFTAGVIAGGFTAFTGVSSIGQFFGAVGNTIGVGFQATMGTLGLSQGVSGSMAASSGVAPGTTLGTGTWAQTLGLSAGPTAGTAAMEAGAAALGPGPFSQQALIEAGTKGGGILGMGQPLAAAPAATSGGLSWLTGEAPKQAVQNTGLFGKITGAFNGMSNVGQVMVAQGVMGSFQSYAESKEAEKQRRQFLKTGVFGVARGERYSGSDATVASIYENFAGIPGTSAAQQRATGTGFFAGTNQGQSTGQTPVPGQTSGQSLIGQTYEEGNQGPSFQNAYVQSYANPYNQNNTQNQPLLG